MQEASGPPKSREVKKNAKVSLLSKKNISARCNKTLCLRVI